jgi:hypothetical protein
MRSKTEQGCSSKTFITMVLVSVCCYAEHRRILMGAKEVSIITTFRSIPCNFQICIRECYMKNYSREQQKRGVMFLESSPFVIRGKIIFKENDATTF